MAVGDVHAVKLGSKSYGIVHVVWAHAEWKQTSVVFLDWFGAEPPALAAVAKAKLLTFRHPELAGEVGWLRKLSGLVVPSTWKRIGKLPPSRAALALPLGDTWIDEEQRHRTTDWRAVPDTLRRELAYRTDPEVAMATRVGPGELVAITTAEGVVVSRVMKVVGRVEEEQYAKRYELAIFDHRFPKVPTLAAAVKTLALPGLTRPHKVVNTSQDVPAGAIRLGHAPLAKGERVAVNLGEHGQWPWPAQRAARHTKVLAARKQAPPLTLASVKPATLFASWKKAGPANRATARAIIATLVTTLRTKTAPSAQRAAVLKAISAFNKTSFIETFEREHICSVISALGQSAGLSAAVVDHLIDARRDF